MAKWEKNAFDRSDAPVLDTLLSYCKRGYLMGGIVFINPFTWNRSKNEPYCGEFGLTRLLIWRTQLILCFVNWIYVFYKFLETQFDPEAVLEMKVYSYFTLVYNSISPTCNLFMALKVDDLRTGTRLCIELIKYLRKQDLDLKSIGSLRQGVWFFRSVFYTFNSVSLLMGIQNFLMPESPEFMSSSFLDENATTLEIIPFVAYTLYQEYHFNSTCFVFVFGQGIIVFTSTIAFMHMRQLLAQKRISSEEDFVNFIILYRKVQFVIHYVDESINSALLINISVISFMTAFATVGCIRLDGSVLVPLLVIAVSAFAFIFGTVAAMANCGHANSTKMLSLLEQSLPGIVARHQNRKMVRLYFRSVTACKMRYGSFSVIDRPFILNCVDNIANWTISILVV